MESKFVLGDHVTTSTKTAVHSAVERLASPAGRRFVSRSQTAAAAQAALEAAKLEQTPDIDPVEAARLRMIQEQEAALQAFVLRRLAESGQQNLGVAGLSNLKPSQPLQKAVERLLSHGDSSTSSSLDAFDRQLLENAEFRAFLERKARMIKDMRQRARRMARNSVVEASQSHPGSASRERKQGSSKPAVAKDTGDQVDAPTQPVLDVDTLDELIETMNACELRSNQRSLRAQQTFAGSGVLSSDMPATQRRSATKRRTPATGSNAGLSADRPGSASSNVSPRATSQSRKSTSSMAAAPSSLLSAQRAVSAGSAASGASNEQKSAPHASLSDEQLQQWMQELQQRRQAARDPWLRHTTILSPLSPSHARARSPVVSKPMQVFHSLQLAPVVSVLSPTSADSLPRIGDRKSMYSANGAPRSPVGSSSSGRTSSSRSRVRFPGDMFHTMLEQAHNEATSESSPHSRARTVAVSNVTYQ